MSRRRIIINNFLSTPNRLTFSFNMTNHLRPGNDENNALTDICITIAHGYEEQLPIWARLNMGSCRVFPISPFHPLFLHLDDESQTRGFFNCLIFSRSNNSNEIQVTHFGPLGKQNGGELKDIIDDTHEHLKNLSNRLKGLKSAELEGKMSEEEAKTQEKEIRQHLANMYAIAQSIESEIKVEKEKLKNLILRVFESSELTEDVEDLMKKMMASTGKVMIKNATKKITVRVAEKIVMKVAAEIAAKTGVKQLAKVGGKSVAKKVPFVGFAVGLGLGVWRLAHGDVAGAGMEVTSGALSCVPGGGTAASFGVDAALAAKDIQGATTQIKRHAEELKAEMTQIEMELNALGEKYDKAKEDYEFAKQVLEDPGFSTKKLQHEIRILVHISTALHQL